MTIIDAFTPVTLGSINLPNRLVLAPLTRTRAEADGVPNALMTEYYTQRASLGMLISEGVYPSAESRAYPGQPGIVTAEQAAGWRTITDSVHQAGGRMVMQLMNSGRVSHPAVTGTDRIVAPSAIAIDGLVRTPSEKLPFAVPHALTAAELPVVLDEFVAAARRAIDAGFDGVELHNANGYLLHQFLSPASNQRTDNYGGSAENRARFGIEVATAVAAAVGSGRVGVRISPEHNIQDVIESDPVDVAATYGALMDGLAPLGLAYLNVLHRDLAGDLVQGLRTRFGGKMIGNSGFSAVTDRTEALNLIEVGTVDAVVVGRAAIANPDLATRWQHNLPENAIRPETFYTPGAEGYTDYPFLDAR